MFRRCIFVLCMSIAPAIAAQESVRYVSDELAVTLREGSGTDSRAVGLLTSGARLELLQSGTDNGYVRVRAPDGREGWVLERYLQKTPIARDRLRQAEREIEEMRGRLEALEAGNSALAEENERLASGRAVAPEELVRENEALRQAMQEYDLERERMIGQYDTERATQNTLILGGILVGSGVLLALLLQWLWPRRRSWGDL